MCKSFSARYLQFLTCSDEYNLFTCVRNFTLATCFTFRSSFFKAPLPYSNVDTAITLCNCNSVSCPIFPLSDLSKCHSCIKTCEFSFLLHHVYVLELKVSIPLILIARFSSRSVWEYSTSAVHTISIPINSLPSMIPNYRLINSGLYLEANLLLWSPEVLYDHWTFGNSYFFKNIMK
jgi:hypothetical protein